MTQDVAEPNALPRWDLSNVYPGLDSREFEEAVAELHAEIARIDPAQTRLRVLYNPDRPRRVSEWLAQSNALVAVNGNFFDPQNPASAAPYIALGALRPEVIRPRDIRRGVFRGVSGVDDARAIPGIDDVRITAKADETLVPLPEGRSYLGFIFASGDEPAIVDRALRDAHARLRFSIDRALVIAEMQ